MVKKYLPHLPPIVNKIMHQSPKQDIEGIYHIATKLPHLVKNIPNTIKNIKRDLNKSVHKTERNFKKSVQKTKQDLKRADQTTKNVLTTIKNKVTNPEFDAALLSYTSLAFAVLAVACVFIPGAEEFAPLLFMAADATQVAGGSIDMSIAVKQHNKLGIGEAALEVGLGLFDLGAIGYAMKGASEGVSVGLEAAAETDRSTMLERDGAQMSKEEASHFSNHLKKEAFSKTLIRISTRMVIAGSIAMTGISVVNQIQNKKFSSTSTGTGAIGVVSAIAATVESIHMG